MVLRWTWHLAICYLTFVSFVLSLGFYLVWCIPNLSENPNLFLFVKLPILFLGIFYTKIQTRMIIIDEVRTHLKNSGNPVIVTWESKATNDQIVKVHSLTSEFDSFSSTVESLLR